MIGLLQRVSRAEVRVADESIARIEAGLLVLVGIERGDGDAEAARLAERLLGYRVFADDDGKMNLSVADIGGAVLLVPQFTLAADTAKGRRPSFTSAAPPDEGQRLFASMVTSARARHRAVHSGRFGADMSVSLVNEGPVTFSLRVSPGG